MCELKCMPHAKLLVKKLEILIRDTAPFSQYVFCDQERNGETWVGWYITEVKISNFWTCRETLSPTIPSLSGTSWSLHKENPGKRAWRACCNDFEKSEPVFSFKAIKLLHIWLKMKKRWQIIWWCSIYSRLFIHFKVRNI